MGAGVLLLLAGAAEWAALRPFISGEHPVPAVVLYHVVGASFAGFWIAGVAAPAGETGQAC